MSTFETTVENDGRKPPSSSTPPLAILVLLCLALLLLVFDEKSFAGWVRLAAIWSTTVGACLLATVTAYLVTWFFKLRSGSIISKLAYCLCLIACGWLLVDAVRDTRRALDPNQWLEVGMERPRLPFEIEPDQRFYTLNLDPKATHGLHLVQATGSQNLLWPEDRRAGEGKRLLWLGWLCTLRNRGMRSLSDITFEAPASYTDDSDHGPREWAVHHVSIPALAPNESLQLLLGSTREHVYVEVYKPKLVRAKIGNESNERALQIRLLPFDDFWDGDNYWLLSGPREIP